jgi:hypothetical protein
MTGRCRLKLLAVVVERREMEEAAEEEGEEREGGAGCGRKDRSRR